MQVEEENFKICNLHKCEYRFVGQYVIVKRICYAGLATDLFFLAVENF